MTTRDEAIKAWDDWTLMWNGDTDLAAQITGEGLRLHFGAEGPFDDITTGAELGEAVAAFRAGYDALTYSTDIGPIVDDAGLVAVRWIADAVKQGTPARKGGIDILRLVEGRIVEVWSVTGTRLLAD